MALGCRRDFVHINARTSIGHAVIPTRPRDGWAEVGARTVSGQNVTEDEFEQFVVPRSQTL